MLHNSKRYNSSLQYIAMLQYFKKKMKFQLPKDDTVSYISSKQYIFTKLAYLNCSTMPLEENVLPQLLLKMC